VRGVWVGEPNGHSILPICVMPLGGWGANPGFTTVRRPYSGAWVLARATAIFSVINGVLLKALYRIRIPTSLLRAVAYRAGHQN